jgi:hypothetical protein
MTSRLSGRALLRQVFGYGRRVRERTTLVAQLAARKRKRMATGEKVEGRKGHFEARPDVVKLAKALVHSAGRSSPTPSVSPLACSPRALRLLGLGWIGATTAFACVVRKPNSWCSPSTARSWGLLRRDSAPQAREGEQRPTVVEREPDRRLARLRVSVFAERSRGRHAAV